MRNEMRLVNFRLGKIESRYLWLYSLKCLLLSLEAILTQIMLSYTLLSKIYTLHYSKGFIFFILFHFHSNFMRMLYKRENTK